MKPSRTLEGKGAELSENFVQPLEYSGEFLF
jgi:hypothetical protein